MKRLSVFFVPVLMIALLVFAAYTVSMAAGGADAKSLFETKCSKCHGFKKALDKQKTAAEWSKTVNRMRDKAPDWISAEEAETIVKHLSE